jgi:hypothetical protein
MVELLTKWLGKEHARLVSGRSRITVPTDIGTECGNRLGSLMMVAENETKHWNI